MNQVLALPIELRLAVIFLAGLFLGGQLNRGIYRLAWSPRPIDPWSPPHEKAQPRRRRDRVPLIGWLFLRRESSLHGRGFWIRPLLIELAVGGGLVALYWYEVHRIGVYQVATIPPSAAVLHAQYLGHCVLISLMVVATFIDFDEQTIPDTITVPGTLAGLLFAALLPISRPLIPVVLANGGIRLDDLHCGSPALWPAWLDGVWGLVIGLCCFGAWWLAIIPWTWTTRRGWAKGIQFLLASLIRRVSPLWALVAVVAAAGIAGVWLVSGSRWESLFCSLVGLAFGGGLIWAVRIVGTYALGQEAMGFGDVTLMAMIGTFVGWQATLIIFFLAPFAAVLISVTQWLLTRRKDIAFGPYLCVAALYLIVNWGDIWHDSARQVFLLGWLVPGMAVICVVLMGGMLSLLHMLRETRGGEEQEPDQGDAEHSERDQAPPDEIDPNDDEPAA